MPRGAVPYPNSLIVGRRQLQIRTTLSKLSDGKRNMTYDPWHFVVELNGSDVVEVTVQSK